MHRLCRSGAGRDNLCFTQIPPTRPEIRGRPFRKLDNAAPMSIFLILGKNLQGARDILSATPKLSSDILSVEDNAIRGQFHLGRIA